MAPANDKKFFDARWQAQGPKLLEPTIKLTECLSYCNFMSRLLRDIKDVKIY